MLGLSALTWFVIIVAGYALLLLILPREYMWIPFVAVVVAMTVLAYHIVPDETDDLYRYYGMLDIMREQGKAGLDYIIERNWYDWQTFVTMRYYFYFLSFFSQQPLFGCDDHVYRLCLNVPGDVQSSPALSGEQRLCAAGYTVFPVHLLVL